MHVITQKRLREFWERNPGAEGPLRGWLKVAERSTWRNFGDVRQACSNTADQVGRCTVFNVGGNKYRLIVHIHYGWGKIFILHVLTHKEYDRETWKDDCC